MSPALQQHMLASPPHRYRDVARRIERQIRDGQFAAGSRLAGERNLSKALGVSRVTLRKALQELRSRGMLVADQAKGWFVAQAGVEEKNVLRSFTELAKLRGFAARSEIISARSRMASAEEAEILRAPGEAQVFEITRIRYMGDEAIGIETSRIPLARCPRIASANLRAGSIHALLGAAGAAPASADYGLTAIVADATQARHLGVEPGAPLLAAEAITRDEAGQVVELSNTVFRGDRYRFHTTLRVR